MTPEQFLLFADPLPEPTLLLADDGLIYAGNRAVAERLGISVSWLQGKRLAEVVVESPDEVSRYLRLCCRSRSLVLGAMRLHINGSEKIACRIKGSLICPKQEGAAAVLMLRLTPKESAGGQFVALNQRIEELGREVQRRKRAEEEQRASADRLSLALSAADLGDWSWDAASDMVKLSVRAAEVFDIPPGSHITWTAMQDLLHPADQERARQEVERVVAERVQYDIEYRANRRDGTHVWVGVLGRAIYDASDQVVGMYGVVQDITERKRHEEALRQSVEELQILMDTLPIGVFVAHDPDCRTITGNAASHALLRTQASNLSKSAPAGEATMPFRVCRNGVEIPPDQLPVPRAARGEFVRDEEVDDLFEDGTAVHTLMSAAPPCTTNTGGCGAQWRRCWT